MYEPEMNGATEAIDALPEEVRRRFAEHRVEVISRTTLPWGEHCTECVWPVCYTTCALYERRVDGACRQFVGPAVRLDHRGGLNPYILKIQFKQWGKLWSAGTLELKPMADADRAERMHIAVGTLARFVPAPTPVKTRVLRRVRARRTLNAERRPGPEMPHAFLLECFNPDERTMGLTFTVRAADRSRPQTFQQRIALAQGYTRVRIAFAAIAGAVDMDRPFEVEIVPNACEHKTLYFGLADFVKERSELIPPAAESGTARKFKCIVWDLDNTLWDGVLLEDGPHGIRLRPHVVDVIKETNARGILHSVASKNNREDALEVLRNLGLDEYFLYPQIAWTPKSESIARISRLLNIGIDSLAFVDDQPFEREEVSAALPAVCVIDASESAGITERPECQVPVTKESMTRRLMYREQQQREAEMETCKGDYRAFLKTCAMEVRFDPLTEENLARVYELAQRTNQMNFSGNRYAESELREILAARERSGYVVQCRDRFGDYGIVGFAVVDETPLCLMDLMFSCRIQAKRVEHAVLTFLLQRYAGDGQSEFLARYRKTPKNAPSGGVFAEMGFELQEECDGVSLLKFRRGRAIPDDKIVKVVAEIQPT